MLVPQRDLRKNEKGGALASGNNGTLQCPTHQLIIVAFPSVYERARVLEEPFLPRAPKTPLEWFIAGRWCQLLPLLVPKAD